MSALSTQKFLINGTYTLSPIIRENGPTKLKIKPYSPYSCCGIKPKYTGNIKYPIPFVIASANVTIPIFLSKNYSQKIVPELILSKISSLTSLL